jgi:hypothetical protein
VKQCRQKSISEMVCRKKHKSHKDQFLSLRLLRFFAANHFISFSSRLATLRPV